MAAVGHEYFSLPFQFPMASLLVWHILLAAWQLAQRYNTGV